LLVPPKTLLPRNDFNVFFTFKRKLDWILAGPIFIFDQNIFQFSVFPIFEIYFPIFSFSTSVKNFHFSIFDQIIFHFLEILTFVSTSPKNPDRIREFFQKGEGFCRMHFGGIFWHLLNRLKIGHTGNARKALRQFGQRISKTGKTSPRFQSNPAPHWAHSPQTPFFIPPDQEGKSTCFSVRILLSEFSSFGNAHFRHIFQITHDPFWSLGPLYLEGLSPRKMDNFPNCGVINCRSLIILFTPKIFLEITKKRRKIEGFIVHPDLPARKPCNKFSNKSLGRSMGWMSNSSVLPRVPSNEYPRKEPATNLSRDIQWRPSPRSEKR